MIDTSNLDNLDLCLVTLGSEEEETELSEEIFCIFIYGVFQNLTDDHHRNKVYGSSVVKFRKIRDTRSLMKHLVDKLWASRDPDSVGEGN